MKKHLSILLTLCMLISVVAAMFVIAPSAEEAPRAKSVYLKNPDGNVAIRDGADLTTLCDGKKHFEYEGVANFNNPGIVLVHNVEYATPQEKADWDYANLVIELDKGTMVDAVNVTFFTYWSAMIGIPNEADVIISYSDDGGENFSELKKFSMEDDDISSGVHILDKYFYLDQVITCDAIMVSMPFGEKDPSWQDGWAMLEWFAFTELSAGLKLDYENADEESSEPEVSVEPYVQAAPDYESYGYTLKQSDDFFVSHFNEVYDGASVIMTKEYANCDYWLHIAFAPVEGQEGMYQVTAMQNGLTDGSASTPFEIPEGGFVWCMHSGTDNSATGGINYNTATITHAIEVGKSLDVGRVVCFENVDFEGEDVHSVNGLTVMWYDSGYQFNSKIHIMLNDGEDMPSDESSEDVSSEEPSVAPESSDDEDSNEEESSVSPESKDESSNVPATNDQSGSFPWWIIIAVVAVVVIAVVVFIIIKKKKQ